MILFTSTNLFFFFFFFISHQGGRTDIPALIVDSANGVGAPKLATLAQHLAAAGAFLMVANDGSSGKLNEKVPFFFLSLSLSFGKIRFRLLSTVWSRLRQDWPGPSEWR